jgi:hypothetical protein
VAVLENPQLELLLVKVINVDDKNYGWSYSLVETKAE